MRCPRKNCQNEALHDATYGILPCQSCQDADQGTSVSSPEFYSQTKQERIQQQRDSGDKDMLQPYLAKGEPNPDFIRAYPEAAKQYFDDATLEAF